eukprot:Clim_evm36s241 gene=Clim_evmTU36s241
MVSVQDPESTRDSEGSNGDFCKERSHSISGSQGFGMWSSDHQSSRSFPGDLRRRRRLQISIVLVVTITLGLAAVLGWLTYTSQVDSQQRELEKQCSIVASLFEREIAIQIKVVEALQISTASLIGAEGWVGGDNLTDIETIQQIYNSLLADNDSTLRTFSGVAAGWAVPESQYDLYAQNHTSAPMRTVWVQQPDTGAIYGEAAVMAETPVSYPTLQIYDNDDEREFGGVRNVDIFVVPNDEAPEGTILRALTLESYESYESDHTIVMPVLLQGDGALFSITSLNFGQFSTPVYSSLSSIGMIVQASFNAKDLVNNMFQKYRDSPNTANIDFLFYENRINVGRFPIHLLNTIEGPMPGGVTLNDTARAREGVPFRTTFPADSAVVHDNVAIDWPGPTNFGLECSQDSLDSSAILSTILIMAVTLLLGAMVLWVLVVSLTRLSQVEKEVRVKTGQLLAAVNEKERAVSAKSEFVSYICHELRNPLQVISGQLEMLSVGGLVREDVCRNYLVPMEEATQRVLRIVFDLLDVHRLDTGKLSIQPSTVSLKNFFNDLLSAHASEQTPEVANFDGVVRNDVNQLYVSMDFVRMRQVLDNLIRNALEACEPENRVTLRVESSTQGQAKDKVAVIMTIVDNGPGIPAHIMPYIFEPNSAIKRMHTAQNKKAGSTGLGLPLCKKLVEAMGGTLKVSSVAGQGTKATIKMVLPVVDAASHRASHMTTNITKTLPEKMGLTPSPSSSIELHRLQAVVMDDAVVNVDIIVKMLQWFNVDPLPFTEPETALEELQERKRADPSMHIDFALVDFDMPGMKGNEFATRLKETYPDCTMVSISALSQTAEIDKVFDGLLPKPIKLEDLRRVVVSHENRTSLSATSNSTCTATIREESEDDYHTDHSEHHEITEVSESDEE